MQGPHRVQHVLVDHVGINLGLGEVGVPEHLLNRVQAALYAQREGYIPPSSP